ncbi:MAG: hypothetical protein A3C80_00605 [Candidatus Ryanbacteria bacterium RIFCSPHIGHO2_02_FULL_45_43]|uniref:D,D-heptose 1,7-bisphosphate phosphatase n=1 Tax=Candidatus Ryanbacteria bacterium RIFCSPHIGHO2_01_45_13 TaxID=1802112 RepID=A0A1G2FYK4_9BACT|nr:MAG: hypothetical protein A2718_01995 [Candidatus Ryanbacteria bacterium RIFCSPHIGHO2_01_FULL_44_130]OGZ42698.1 MAG: hypothetical protein A2W41_03070 [Candidatus Ryanbacteria bacterium RIFCSPHIGHO2_01_45_13]OGZ48814.1 MAG: hypothetical protein A3C80_00605 [Candidatus Ryanbacteria bacterium RIFCSPHIGHO2_02_FULL_45_43]OGZ50846.1 MAG: hypothetical protein A3E55_02625 [Candidatus Ryanbacteria bacterium RIFCSPHIGHO2_12_FULL_44_20]OGZ52057.1 MAG: hypothetical protein A3A17_01210 [Candidatus Ryanba
MNKAVFLDRDGILNKLVMHEGKPRSPWTFSDFEILPDVREAVSTLKAHDFLCIVVTNQPDIHPGWLSLDELEKMHLHLLKELPLDHIYFCPHPGDSDCECSKPKPGMAHEAAKKFCIDFPRSFVVGDRWRDIDLGKNIGSRTILIPTEATHFDGRELAPDYMGTNLLHAVKTILTLEDLSKDKRD